MALMQCSFFAESLGVGAAMNVIIPQQTGAAMIGMSGSKARKKWPVLYLLHGLSDDHTTWLRRTSIERYVADKGLAVVMPAVNRSFYSDMEYGAKYWTFLSEELPALVKSFFPISDRREDTFAAGLSMGGYGALKLALRCPEKFAAAAGLSSVADVGARQVQWPGEFRAIFGERAVAGSDDDLFALAGKLAASGDRPRPALYQCCGTEDFLYEDNLRLRDHLRKLRVEAVYRECPGTHNWGFWDTEIQAVLDWLPIRGEMQ